MEVTLVSSLIDDYEFRRYESNKKWHSVYTKRDIQELIEVLSRSNMLVRLVDPDECRVLNFDEDGNLEYGQTCFAVWGSQQRCSHCTSYRACKSNTEQVRRERINGRVWKVRSVPVCVELDDGEDISCSLEIINPEMGTFAGDPTVENNTNNEEYLLFHDILTGLYNEDGMRRAVRTELETHRDTDYVLVVTDVRRFSLVNDLFGTNTGNEALIGITHMLLNYAGEHAVCCRIRADQFAVFMPAEEFDPESFSAEIKKAGDLIRQPYYHLHLYAAAFYVTGRERHLPVSVMVDRARLALERIKTNQQINFIWFDDEMIDETLREQRIISSFQSNLESGAFKIFLQPQVDNKGYISGAEALVRLVQDDGEVISPSEFIPVLEKSDLISHLDAYVWELVAKTLNSWKGTELSKCYIAVNVSSKDVYYIDVAKTLEDLCSKYEIPTSSMHVEITETGLMKNMENHTAIIEDLHRRGFYIDIDDFGKGASSLSVLRNVDADVVKIDMGFLHNKGNEDKRDVILSSVIDMTRRLGMDVITEGVETEEQQRALEEMGCFRYQGYYFSEAVPVPEFEYKYKRAMKALNGNAENDDK